MIRPLGLAGLLALSGCGGGAVPLSDIARAACVAQAAANAAEQIADRRGRDDWARRFGRASELIGYGCVW